MLVIYIFVVFLIDKEDYMNKNTVSFYKFGVRNNFIIVDVVNCENDIRHYSKILYNDAGLAELVLLLKHFNHTFVADLRSFPKYGLDILFDNFSKPEYSIDFNTLFVIFEKESVKYYDKDPDI